MFNSVPDRRASQREWTRARRWCAVLIAASLLARRPRPSVAQDAPPSPATRPADSAALVDSAVPADQGADQAAARAALAPFITDTTALVAQVDPSALDFPALDALVDRLAQAVPGAGANPDQSSTMLSISSLKKWFTAFKQAGGGRIYVVGYLGNPSDIPVAIVVPLADAGQAKAISSLLINGQTDGQATDTPGEGTSSASASPLHLLPFLRGVPFKAIVLHQAVVVGSVDLLDRLPDQTPARRPDIAAALSATDDHALAKLSVVPPFALKILASAAAPAELPDWLGGGTTETLIMGLSWANFTLDAPPGESAVLQAKFSGDLGAQACAHMITSYLAACRTGSVLPDTETDALVKSLTPQVQGNELTVKWDAQTMKSLVEPLFVHGLQIGHQQALVTQSASNVRQLLLACMIYSNEHHGQWPASLDQLAPIFSPRGLAQLLADPARPGSGVAYIYVQPPINVRFSAVVIHEIDNGHDPVVVGYADGSTTIMSPADFQQTLHPQTPHPATQPTPTSP